MSDIIIGGINNNVNTIDFPPPDSRYRSRPEAKVVTVGSTAVWCKFSNINLTTYAQGDFSTGIQTSWTGERTSAHIGEISINSSTNGKHNCSVWMRMWVTSSVYYDVELNSYSGGGLFETTKTTFNLKNSSGTVIYTNSLSVDGAGASLELMSTTGTTQGDANPYAFRLLWRFYDMNNFVDNTTYNNASSYKNSYPKIYYAALKYNDSNLSKVTYSARYNSYSS